LPRPAAAASNDEILVQQKGASIDATQWAVLHNVHEDDR
jgi:hypothetical protein